MQFTRSCGLLCHISSLPSPFGIGDVGPDAFRFVDFLHQSGQSIWQILPIVPTGHGHSPYSSPSTFAGNTLFISPEKLVAEGLVTQNELDEVLLWHQEAATGSHSHNSHVNFDAARKVKKEILGLAWGRFTHEMPPFLVTQFSRFKQDNASWLEDYVLFDTIKDGFGGSSWTAWPEDLRNRDSSALDSFAAGNQIALEKRRFEQFLFAKQWAELRGYCASKGVRLFGDLPIYVAHDSADVWAHPHLFELDENGSPVVVAGVPPDYFSETGQRWGNPIYRWDVMKRDGYAWWNARLHHILNQVDVLRLDHFRGFEAFWVVPATEETAVNGSWRKGPAEDLFSALENQRDPQKYPHGLPIVAEDLGVITPEVTQLMEAFNYPGMAVLQFGFGSGMDNVFLPHHYKPQLVAYSGTHDNNTWIGWWTEPEGGGSLESFEQTRAFCAQYFGLDQPPASIDAAALGWKAIGRIMESRANLVVLPVQDVLELGKEGRMNIPGTSSGNWDWRIVDGQLTAAVAARLRHLSEATDRC